MSDAEVLQRTVNRAAEKSAAQVCKIRKCSRSHHGYRPRSAILSSFSRRSLSTNAGCVNRGLLSWTTLLSGRKPVKFT